MRQLGPEDKQVVERWLTVQMLRPGEAKGKAQISQQQLCQWWSGVERRGEGGGHG